MRRKGGVLSKHSKTFQARCSLVVELWHQDRRTTGLKPNFTEDPSCVKILVHVKSVVLGQNPSSCWGDEVWRMEGSSSCRPRCPYYGTKINWYTKITPPSLASISRLIQHQMNARLLAFLKMVPFCKARGSARIPRLHGKALFRA
ncbi:hypothetical protein AVEN_59236-1 [Araneus ventricosus]|uniref:Uncharacterized protein n=1 Tax=Araneus ventricosus TaxID=182803 RepID=A0A4Y2CZE5_ARAVE|nr:hypothetical protein AVEN_59236-1 [Araneus ventricosus]